MYIEQLDLCTIMYIHTQHTHNYSKAHMNTRASIIWCQIIEKATTWEGTN